MLIGPKASRLRYSGSVVLDAAGAGEVTIGPVPPQQRWELERIAVLVGDDDPMPKCFVYEGPANPDNLLDATYTGAQDVSDMNRYALDDAEFLTVRWEGGQPGATATVRATGRQELL